MPGLPRLCCSASQMLLHRVFSLAKWSPPKPHTSSVSWPACSIAAEYACVTFCTFWHSFQTPLIEYCYHLFTVAPIIIQLFFVCETLTCCRKYWLFYFLFCHHSVKWSCPVVLAENIVRVLPYPHLLISITDCQTVSCYSVRCALTVAHPKRHIPPPSSSPSAPRSEITSPSVWPEPAHAKLMGALLSKAPPQLFTLINLMWRSVEGIVWKSSQCHDPVPCRWTEGELGNLREGGWEREPGKRERNGGLKQNKNRYRELKAGWIAQEEQIYGHKYVFLFLRNENRVLVIYSLQRFNTNWYDFQCPMTGFCRTVQQKSTWKIQFQQL